LGFLREILGTAKPDTAMETGHFSARFNLRKWLIFLLFPHLSRFFPIPDKITVEIQACWKIGSA